jgi:hypothetical protein
MVGRSVMRERRVWMEDLGLYADTLRHVVIHSLEIDSIAKRETARKAVRLEGAEGNDDNFGIFRCEAHKDEAKVCWPSAVIKS